MPAVADIGRRSGPAKVLAFVLILATLLLPEAGRASRVTVLTSLSWSPWPGVRRRPAAGAGPGSSGTGNGWSRLLPFASRSQAAGRGPSGTVPPFMPEGRRYSCTSCPLSLSSHCTKQTTADRDITLWLCPARGQGHLSGVLVVTSPLASRNVYTLRLAGPEIIQLPIYYCSDTEAHAPYTLHRSGTYDVELLHLYTKFTYPAQGAFVQRPEIFLARLNLTAAAAPGAGSCKGEDCPVCSKTTHTGRWVASRRTPALSTSCLTSCYQNRLTRTADPALLSWQPSGCRFDRQLSLDACLRDRHICFVGDSQTRHLHNGLAVAYLAEHGIVHDPGPLNVTYRAVVHTPVTNFTSMSWGNLENVTLPDTCTDLVVNFGQWAASHQTNGDPWSAERYMSRLLAIKAVMLEHSARGVRTYWTTTVAFPLLYSHHYPQETDYRLDPLLLLYNTLATGLFAKSPVRVLDIFQISYPLRGLSYDKAHFYHTGSVGHAMNQYIMHALCGVEP